MAFLAALPTVGAAPLLGGLAGIGAALFGKKSKQGPQALSQVTRDDASAAIANQDELRKRKGGAADILNGTTGAEAALSGGKLVLGS